VIEALLSLEIPPRAFLAALLAPHCAIIATAGPGGTKNGQLDTGHPKSQGQIGRNVSGLSTLQAAGAVRRRGGYQAGNPFFSC
jgi:hypothetical protein